MDEAAPALGVFVERLGGRAQDRATTLAREALVLVGTERYRLRLNDLARALAKSPDTLAHWVSRGARRRLDDPAFAALVARLAAELN